MENKNSLSTLFSATLTILKNTWLNLLLAIFFIISIILALILLSTVIYYALVSKSIINLDAIYSFRLIWQVCIYIISFLISVAAQYLIINTMINPRLELKDNLKSIKNNFSQFLFLNIIIQILFFIITIPIYLSGFLFLFGNIILAIAALLLGIIIIVLFVSYFVFSPFFLIEEKLSFVEAIKKSITSSQNNIFNIIFNLILLAFIIVIINSFSVLIISVPFIGLILSTIISLILIMFSFTYLMALYQNYKIS